jgi:hypothetical protein
MDLTIAMGHQAGNDAPIWSIQVTMSWEEAKFLATSLQAQIADYEASFGEVRDVIKAMQDFVERFQADQQAQEGQNVG